MSQSVAEADGLLDELRHQASRIRQAIEATELRDCGCNLSEFPNGCCHHAVKLLAFHLFELGWCDPQRVTGMRNGDPRYPHLWLLVGGVIIDITADQFSEGQPPVIVARQSLWHETWERTVEPLDVEILVEWRAVKRTDYDLYRKIMANLPDKEPL